MSFDWTQYLNLAKFIQARAVRGSEIDKEAGFRSAVGRAYYAAFCYARNYARDNYHFSPTYGPDDHGLVPELFRGRGQTDITEALLDLRRWRNQCDYWDVVSGNLSAMSAGAIVDAQYVIENA